MVSEFFLMKLEIYYFILYYQKLVANILDKERYISISHSVVSNSWRLHELSARLLYPQNSPGKNSLLQGVFLTQELKPGFLHHSYNFYHLSHQGSPSPLLVQSNYISANFILWCEFCLQMIHLKGCTVWTSLLVQWIRIHLQMQGVCVWSLVRELRSHMPRGQNTTTENRRILQQIQ